MSEFDDYLRGQVRIKAFIKGPPGCGKTVLAAGITHLGRTLYVDVEGGVMSAVPVVNRQNIVLRVIKQPDNKMFFEKLGEVMGEAMSGEYDAVVIDSLTEIAGRMEDEYATAQGKGGEVGIKDWFLLTDRVKRLSRTLRDLPCHTVVCALTKPTGREEANAIFEPILPGQTSAIVPSFFDIVGLLRKGSGKAGDKFFFSTMGPSVFQVRDRTHTLAGEEEIDNPARIWKKILEGLAHLSDAPVEAQAS